VRGKNDQSIRNMRRAERVTLLANVFRIFLTSGNRAMSGNSCWRDSSRSTRFNSSSGRNARIDHPMTLLAAGTSEPILMFAPGLVMPARSRST
jgi:hypothetical protein